MEKKPKILARRTIYESEWLRVHADRVEFPAGRIVEAHHCVEFPKSGVGAIVTNEAGDLLLIRSYRYIFDSVEWEIPAGSFESDEPVLAAAEREALEETGYQTTGHRLAYTYYPMTGMCRSVFYLVTCRAAAHSGTFDANEVHSVAWKTRSEILRMLERGEIRDGFSLTGVFLYLTGADFRAEEGKR
ncbi:MAG TPA: NUDIX domain-containing protein [Verrucomicrobiae bacterium]|nr:NUDIX domain-containing protein [Verrucomicrobiae bacterium]